MRRELVTLLRAVAIQEAQCEAGSDRLRRLRESPGAAMFEAEILEAERLTERFQDEFVDGMRMLEAAMARFFRTREAARAQGLNLYGLDVPVWDDELRRQARAHVAELLDLDRDVLAQEDHERFSDRLGARV
jgi:hypothetical protein